jgi:membrane-bound lytic murein transglycosylase D
MLPENIKNYPLRVPAQSRELLALNRAAILDSSRVPVLIKPRLPEIMLAAATPAKQPDSSLPADSAATDSLQQSAYVVVRGDFLERIAKKNQVTIAQLKEWNNLSGSTLMPGQKLVVYTAGSPAPQTLDKPAATSQEAELKETKSLATNNTRKAPISQDMKMIHAVQAGDTLYNISKRYNNIPVERIKKLNKLKSDEIKPGQKLVIS